MPDQFPDGDGIFETIKVVDGRSLFLEEHIARAQRSADRIGIIFPNRMTLLRQIQEKVAINQDHPGEARLRISFLRSGEVIASYSPYLKWNRPASVMVSDWLVNELSTANSVKSLPFTSHIKALESARTKGFDEIVRFNTSGFLAEAASANLLLKLNGDWFTPNLASGCLPGIMRAFFIEHGLAFERAILKTEFAKCEAIFLISSLREIQPVSQVDDRELTIDETHLLKAEQELARFR